MRHGKTDWNLAGRWQGWADRSLTREARSAARDAGTRIAERFPGLSGVVTSDLSRARETGELVAGAADLPVLGADRNLREIDLGHWTGLTKDEIELTAGEHLVRWYRDGVAAPGACEDRSQFTERILRGLRNASTLGRDVLVVTHAVVIATLQVLQEIDDGTPQVTSLRVRPAELDANGVRLSDWIDL